ncbi:MAG: hypothetical protein ACLP1X_18040 [Polyangiaceae bacterium]
MLDIFRPLPIEARRESLDAYQKFLAGRDGALDLEKKQLDRREAGMLRYERPLSRIRGVDRDLFKAQYASFDAKVATPPEMVLLLALVKMNAAEAFGVNETFDKVFHRAVKNDDMCELTLLIEETYHTRILLSTAMSYGVEVSAAFEPPAALRALIAGIARTPTFVSRPLTLAAEVLGVLSFLNLLEKTRDVLRHDPELRDAVEERLCEIIVDELGHMSFNRACLGAAGMAQARVLLPIVAKGLAGVLPEIRALGVTASAAQGDVTALASGRRLPEHVLKSAFIS